MYRISMPLIMLWLSAVSAPAAEHKFPYEATIDIAEEYVRSGPGQKFYPTSKLRRGDRVTVQRHDPGGWYMISPPEGSFSWIQADHVHRKHEQTGVLTQNNVIVRVGSEYNDERDWYQRELNKGDTVEILSEKTFQTERGPVKMYKIKPPAHEYRWIMGKALLPAGAPVRKPHKPGDVAETPRAPPKSPLENRSDPFTDGPASQREFTEEPFHSGKEELPVTESAPTRQTGPAASELQQIRERLAAVDKEFHAMIEDDPSTWNLTSMEQQYKQLEEMSANLPAFKTKIKQRLSAVEKYTKIQQEYAEFVKVTSETKQRDAQLLSLKNQPAGDIASVPPTDTSNTTPPPKAAPALPKSFDGAGIIQRSAMNGRGGPQFVLVTPGGRVLCYLQPAPGVDLNAYVGQTVGIIGQRSYRQELQSDLIVVRSMQPVKLKGGT